MSSQAIPFLLHQELAGKDPGFLTGLKRFGCALHLNRVLDCEIVDPQLLRDEAQSGLNLLRGYPKVSLPCLIRICKSQRAVDRRIRFLAFQEIGAIGPAAAEAIPLLVAEAENTNGLFRGVIYNALGKIRSEASVVVPVLTRALKDPMTENRFVAADALAAFGGQAMSSVGALIELREEEGKLAQCDRSLGPESFRAGRSSRPSLHAVVRDSADRAIHEISDLPQTKAHPPNECSVIIKIP